MSKKKVIALLMTGVLVVGGAVGTYAWFTDSEIASANLIINTGTLKIDKDETSDNWTVSNNNNTEIDNKDGLNNFTNVKPEDSFERTFTVKNTGTLTQKISSHAMTPKEFTSKLKEYGNAEGNEDFKGIENILTLDSIEGVEEETLEKDKTKSFTIKVTLKGKETTNGEETINWEARQIDLTKVLKDMNFIKVDATQTNAN
ncbi:TasA family protein [Clostridium sp.]|uniref:TasA family protein n=1 Tax=Clostridium sp. TaxID=1506 RepID=UPI003217917C